MTKKKEDFLDAEEKFHGCEKKDSRQERKRLSQKDRSRFKKTDQDQLKNQQTTPFDHTGLLKGKVIAILSDGIIVSCEGQEWICSLKGSLKKNKERSKNIVAVGDSVFFEPGQKPQGTIAHVEERFSVLSRADHISQHKEQLIAVNVDQVIITTSISSPPLKPFLIDRYLIAADKGNLKPIILVNKIDLLEEGDEKELYEMMVKAYTDLKIPVLAVSFKTKEGLEELKALLKNKTSVFSGQSGTGKSSLINLIARTDLTTGDVVGRTKKGSHTTTNTRLLPLPEGGWCVDTPGVQSFGLFDIERSDIAAYFSEITALSTKCRYTDCSHLGEKQCAVAEAVTQGVISPLRFASYCALMASLLEKHQPR